MRSSTTSDIWARCSRGGGLAPAPAAGGLGVAEPPPGRVQQRQVGGGPGRRLVALQRADLLGRQPRSAQAQVRGHRPQVADQVGRLEQRPRAAEGPGQVPVLRQGATVAAESSPAGRRRRSRRSPVRAPSSSASSSRVVEPSATLSARIPRSASQTSSRASLCGVPGLGRVERLGPVLGARGATSAHGVADGQRLGRRLARRTARPARSRRPGPRDALSRATSGSVSVAAVAPSGTRSRSVQVSTPSSPRLGSTSET